MRFGQSAIAVGFLLVLTVTDVHAGPEGPAFPENEAVRFVNGRRVVERPPLTPATKRFVEAGGKMAPPAQGSEVFMIEGDQGLMECRGVYLSTTGCIPSTLGITKRARFWTVKVAGTWLHCDSRKPSKKCELASAGVPGGMGTVE